MTASVGIEPSMPESEASRNQTADAGEAVLINRNGPERCVLIELSDLFYISQNSYNSGLSSCLKATFRRSFFGFERSSLLAGLGG